MSHDIDDDFVDGGDFVDSGDTEGEVLDDIKAKPLDKRLKIDAMLEEQRLKKLQQALEQGDEFDEFDEFDDI